MRVCKLLQLFCCLSAICLAQLATAAELNWKITSNGFGVQPLVKVTVGTTLHLVTSDPTPYKVSIQPISSDKLGSRSVFSVEVDKNNDAEFSFGQVGTYSVELRVGKDLKAKVTVEVINERRDGPMRLDLGYGFFRLSDDEFFRDNNQNIQRAQRNTWTDTAALLTHYVAPPAVSKSLNIFRNIGYKDEEFNVAFTFGIPAPGTTSPAKYFAGMSLLFGTDKNVAFTFGAAFGSVTRKRSDVTLGVPYGANEDPIPTVKRTVSGFFLGISLKGL